MYGRQRKDDLVGIAATAGVQPLIFKVGSLWCSAFLNVACSGGQVVVTHVGQGANWQGFIDDLACLQVGAGLVDKVEHAPMVAGTASSFNSQPALGVPPAV